MPLFDLVSPSCSGRWRGRTGPMTQSFPPLLWRDVRPCGAARRPKPSGYFCRPGQTGDPGPTPGGRPATICWPWGFCSPAAAHTRAPGGVQQEPRIAFTPSAPPAGRPGCHRGRRWSPTPVSCISPGGCWRYGAEAAPYENVLREAATWPQLEPLSPGAERLHRPLHDRLTRNRTPEQVLELFGQYEEQAVSRRHRPRGFRQLTTCSTTALLWRRGWTSAENAHLRALALDYAPAGGRPAPQAAAAVRSGCTAAGSAGRHGRACCEIFILPSALPQACGAARAAERPLGPGPQSYPAG